MEHICIVKKGAILFRYDLIEPPMDWEVNYKSIEYSLNGLGKPKNLANYFFFFSNEDVARKTASVAVKNTAKEKDGYWLTSAYVLRDLNLLCLCGNDTLYNLIKLHEAGFDVMTDEFSFYNNGVYKHFSELKEPFEKFLNSDFFDIERKLALRDTIVKPFDKYGFPFGLLGQTLTDYENGIPFAKLLADKGYDGYVFDESVGGHTVCLINDVVTGNFPALSKPEKRKVCTMEFL